MWRPGRRWLWGIALAALTAFVVLGCICRHYRVYSPHHWLVYQAMKQECHPAWQDYNFRRVNAGDDVEEVIRRTKPERIERRERWVTLSYRQSTFTGLTAHAYDGKMVIAYAGSCTWVKLFFDDTSEGQCLELMGTYKKDPRRFGIVPVYR